MLVADTLQRYSALTEEGLRKLFVDRNFPLYRLMEYQLGWRTETGESLDYPSTIMRLHGSLCLMTCEGLIGTTAKAVPSSIAVELISQFTQIHNDIQEGSQSRYQRPTVWWIWGPGQAINAGDGLHALARLSLLQQDPPVAPESTIEFLQALDHASLRMCEGMYLEMEHQERIDVFPDTYLKMAREKVGALLGCGLEMGAMAAGAPKPICSALKYFGEEIGIALQIQEDIQSLWGEPLSGKVTGIDLLNKKKGYPVILSLAEAPISQKRELGTLFFKRVLESRDIEQVKAILDGLGSREKAQQVARDTVRNAEKHLSEVGLTDNNLDDIRRTCEWLALRV